MGELAVRIGSVTGRRRAGQIIDALLKQQIIECEAELERKLNHKSAADALFGGFVPGGVFNLPEICVDAGVAPPQVLEIKWLHMGEVVCTDSIETFCEPDCGYMFEKSIECDVSAGLKERVYSLELL